MKWFVGLGAGTQLPQIAAEKKFVDDFNSSQYCLALTLEIVPNATAYDALKTEIAAARGPDILGPAGTGNLVGLDGYFLDLGSEIASHHTDLSGFDPAVVDFWNRADGQIGLPYEIDPGCVFYDKDLFAAAGLPPLPTKVGQQYQGRAWTWDALASVAAQLTTDKNGKNATQLGFDPKHIVRYGFDAGSADARQFASAFGAGTIEGPDSAAQIPDTWVQAWNWYYDAIWKNHAAAPENQSQVLPNAGSSPGGAGHAAMELSWPSEIQSFAAQGSAGGNTFAKKWDIGVVPSYNGTTTTPMFADTFSIMRASKYPDQAYEVLQAILADPSLMKAYGGVPARLSDQPAYFAAMDATLAPIFPGNQVTWSVIDEMASRAAKPSPETDVPNDTQSKAILAAFWEKLRTDQTLDLTAGLAGLKSDLQMSFYAVQPGQ